MHQEMGDLFVKNEPLMTNGGKDGTPIAIGGKNGIVQNRKASHSVA
jgi:hypothetical protein